MKVQMQKCVQESYTEKQKGDRKNHSFAVRQKNMKLQMGTELRILREGMRELMSFYVTILWYFTEIQNLFIEENRSSHSENGIFLH